jgi:hypothetical protein
MMSARLFALFVLTQGDLAAHQTASRSYVGSCDGSAAALLTHDLFVGANDEDNRLRLYRVDGEPTSPTAELSLDHFLGSTAEADIEGAAADGNRIYWITSHGRNKNGKVRPERQKFFATVWNGKALEPVGAPRNDLLQAMVAEPAFAPLHEKLVLEAAPEKGGINIEGLALGGGGALLIGFRSPLLRLDAESRAIIVPLLNPGEIIADAGASPRFGDLISVNLGGRGIRSIERRADGSYLIVAGASDGGDDFAVFSWAGKEAAKSVSWQLGDLAPEALLIRDEEAVLLSDDGTDACKANAAALRRFRGRMMHLKN